MVAEQKIGWLELFGNVDLVHTGTVCPGFWKAEQPGYWSQYPPLPVRTAAHIEPIEVSYQAVYPMPRVSPIIMQPWAMMYGIMVMTLKCLGFLPKSR